MQKGAKGATFREGDWGTTTGKADSECGKSFIRFTAPRANGPTYTSLGRSPRDRVAATLSAEGATYSATSDASGHHG